MEGTNQANTTTYESRLNVYNITTTYSGSGLIDTTNLISCDYVAKIHPSKTDDFSYITCDYGVQDAGKVAGESLWNTMTKGPISVSKKLITRMPNLNEGVDNVMITASVTNYQCVKFFVSHDTAGDLTFIDHKEIANTQRDGAPDGSLPIPIIFGETSYPIMPFVGCGGYYAWGRNDILAQGNFSQLDAATKNLATLYDTINTNWSLGKTPPELAYTIPPRMTKLTITESCFNTDLKDRTETISPDGFSGQTAEKTFTLNKSQMDATGFVGYIKAVVRLGDFTENSSDGLRLVKNGFWNYSPTRLTQLNRQLGFNKLLVSFDTNNPQPDPEHDEATWLSTSTPEPNLTPNYIVNISNMGRIQGQNSATGSISQMIGVIPNAELHATGNYSDDRHYIAPYSLPVKLNARTKENINNFNIFVTRDNGKPARNLLHPSNFLLRIT